MKKTLLILSLLISTTAIAEDDFLVCAAVIPNCVIDESGIVRPEGPESPGNACYEADRAYCEKFGPNFIEKLCQNSNLENAIDDLKNKYEDLNNKNKKLKKQLQRLKRAQR